MGANVIIVARDVDQLQVALKQIQKSARTPAVQRFHQVQADVTAAAECARVVAEAMTWNDGAPPDIVWCCSGSAHPTLYIDTPVEKLQAMMDSNYFSCAYMAHAILNVWLREPLNAAKTRVNNGHEGRSGKAQPTPLARHLIFTASFVSFYSFAGFTPYAPSKAAVRSLSDSLSQEMNLYAAANPSAPRVRLHTIFPATMPTKSLDEENRVKTDLTKSLEEGDQVLEPEECARRSIAGLEAGQELIATSTIIRLVKASTMGGSIRGGFLTGLVDTLLGWIVLVVMVYIRWEMDIKVARWGREHGATGMILSSKAASKPKDV